MGLSLIAMDDRSTLGANDIDKLFHELDEDGDGFVDRQDLERKINAILSPTPGVAEPVDPPGMIDPEKQEDITDTHRGVLEALLDDLLPGPQGLMNSYDFHEVARWWTIPNQDIEQNRYQWQLTRWRRLLAYWTMHSGNIIFIACIIACQLGVGTWQMMPYINDPLAIQAMGPGIIIAKFCAGALYPTMAFMLLSMSRHLNTFLRRSYYLSRFINYDHSQKFHVIMAVIALLLATTHGIAHMTGDMMYASRPSDQDELIEYLGPGRMPPSYGAKLRTLPVSTGLTALGIFWLMALMGMPFIRKRYFEIFQLSHLLMFPFIGLLCAHGTAQLLQKPQLGYWLVGPSLLVLTERLLRLARGLRPVSATIKVLEGQAVVLTCRLPAGKEWRYRAGQYVLIQVPNISRFQWHPFTVTSCRGNELEVHIKNSGNWTRGLRDLGEDIRVGVDGPFGAPAQRFYDYDYSIVIGNGIGVTPCSAILSDLEEKFASSKDPWVESQRSRLQIPSRPILSRSQTSIYPSKEKECVDSAISWGRALSRNPSFINSKAGTASDASSLSDGFSPVSGASTPTKKAPSTKSSLSSKSSFDSTTSRSSPRKLEVHWTVRSPSNISWFSDLLNRIIDQAEHLSLYNILDLRIKTYITAKPKDLSTQIFTSMLDGLLDPTSPLTGLKQRSQFGRPDFEEIMERHFQSLLGDVSREVVTRGLRGKKVGVFYCGMPVVGQLLSDLCRQLTARAKGMGLRIRYNFHTEVFD